MVTPYVGEIRMFGGNFAPVGWQWCNGNLVSISEYEVLYQLIGTTYGGNGTTNFGLPDLRGRVPLHMGTGAGGTYILGQPSGTETVTLASSQMPQHNHTYNASLTQGNQSNPTNEVIASGGLLIYKADPTTVQLSNTAIGFAGGNQPHENIQPFQCLNYIIAMFGVYPQQS